MPSFWIKHKFVCVGRMCLTLGVAAQVKNCLLWMSEHQEFRLSFAFVSFMNIVEIFRFSLDDTFAPSKILRRNLIFVCKIETIHHKCEFNVSARVKGIKPHRGFYFFASTKMQLAAVKCFSLCRFVCALHFFACASLYRPIYENQMRSRTKWNNTFGA